MRTSYASYRPRLPRIVSPSRAPLNVCFSLVNPSKTSSNAIPQATSKKILLTFGCHASGLSKPSTPGFQPHSLNTPTSSSTATPCYCVHSLHRPPECTTNLQQTRDPLLPLVVFSLAAWKNAGWNQIQSPLFQWYTC